MADTISIPPSPASSSPSLGHDAPEASQSSCIDYVLPPVPIDATPISQLLPVAFTEQAHELYEAKAPPPLPLPPLLARPKKSPPPGPRAVVVPRCVPPRSNAHTAFPSPPTSPIPSNSPVVTARPKATTSPSAQRRALAQRHGRRYLAPAFVRGECLPFAIAEENESERRPSTSASEYSADSMRVAGTNTITTTTNNNNNNIGGEWAFTGGGFGGVEALSPDAEPERPWRSVPMEKRCSAKKKKTSFRTRVHRVMLLGPALSLRGRLHF
ncbi:hypothetical protein HYPSUDRAFT_1012719 [Hypholoma sublateritium FD-334 SS-4]|uniref:Uncharacterized protein n=1 Tax=Hypholoma sublateritium (strain FD-334 SS-4) TaxID=945553 RepID=A0A0D2NLR8_HYPSF|nr:hypothetical protein HYPSUDRAFT_1012719 [Hypholoma sublateritium FD-334 SS-4]